jgi:hypothetical protein
MEIDVRRYFHSYMQRQEKHNPMLTRAANEFYRGGVTHMDTLCELLDNSPGELLQIRNIGEKSIALSQAVCKAYRQERGDSA